MTKTLYERIGGFSTVRRLVSDFYHKVLDEDDLVPFFVDTDMARLVDHQTKFWSTLLGGPASYSQSQLEVIHRTIEIQGRHFDLVIELIRETVEDHDLEQDAIDDICAAFDSYRGAITGGSDRHV